MAFLIIGAVAVSALVLVLLIRFLWMVPNALDDIARELKKFNEMR